MGCGYTRLLLRLQRSYHDRWVWIHATCTCSTYPRYISAKPITDQTVAAFPFVPLHCTRPPLPPPSNMPAWYPLQLDPWQLSLKYSNSATELSSDLVAQLARAWQAICQVAGSSASLNYCIFSPSIFLIITSHLSFSMTLTRLKSDCHCMPTIWKVDANHEEDACKIRRECTGLGGPSLLLGVEPHLRTLPCPTQTNHIKCRCRKYQTLPSCRDIGKGVREKNGWPCAK